jgi:asparagine synthase (glutamine-hydrolysing)
MVSGARRLRIVAERADETPGVGRDVDLGSVYSYLNFGFVPVPGSIFAGLLRLPPGHLAKLRMDGSLVEPYWDMTYPVWQRRHVDGAGLP